MATPLFLFDIDLTMVRTHGVGRAAMTTTMHTLTGVPAAFENMSFAGRTDLGILREALLRAAHEVDDFQHFCAKFCAQYLPHLDRELQQRGGAVLPGVVETLSQVQALPNARMGLATGNFREAAWMKLRRFGLDHWFTDGGFAEDGEDRRHLVAAAIDRLAAGITGACEVIVIGDSEHDISAAKANGAIAVGVATGSAPAADLHAAGADLVVDDLTAPGELLRSLGYSARP